MNVAPNSLFASAGHFAGQGGWRCASPTMVSSTMTITTPGARLA